MSWFRDPRRAECSRRPDSRESFCSSTARHMAVDAHSEGDGAGAVGNSSLLLSQCPGCGRSVLRAAQRPLKTSVRVLTGGSTTPPGSLPGTCPLDCRRLTAVGGCAPRAAGRVRAQPSHRTSEIRRELTVHRAPVAARDRSARRVPAEALYAKSSAARYPDEPPAEPLGSWRRRDERVVRRTLRGLSSRERPSVDRTNEEPIAYRSTAGRPAHRRGGRELRRHARTSREAGDERDQTHTDRGPDPMPRL